MSDFRGNEELGDFSSKAFAQDVQRLGIIKRFVCFFDSANFLMTPYCPLTESIHAIFEFESGDTLQFEKLLCGYGGHGPSNTVQALSILGISEEQADWYCRTHAHRGFQLELEQDENGHYQVSNVSFHCWFDPWAENNLISDHNYAISPVQRTVVVVRPEERLDDLWRLVRCCDPFSMDYSTDAKNPLYTERELRDGGLLFGVSDYHHESMNANVRLYGDSFDVYICFNNESLLSMLNVLCFSLTGRALLYVRRFWRFLYVTDIPTWAMSVSRATRVLRDGSITQTRGNIQIKTRK